MNDFTLKELAYVQVLQGIVSSSQQMRLHRHEVVHDAIALVDILFDQIEAKRKEQITG